MSEAIVKRLPAILNIPPKLYPLLSEFNNYRYFLIEGGRGSGKTQSVARIISHICDQVQARVVCGRETQNSIEESVYTVFKDLIRNYELSQFEVLSNKIRNTTTLSDINFKGFREQGSVNIKGLEGVKILWIDEAQSVTQKTLDVLIPTIRDDKAKLIFTMNRFMRDDAVPNFLEGRSDCLHIKINYWENPFCPLSLKNEAEIMRLKSERDYRHIWLGEPLAAADDYLFNYEKLNDALTILPFGEIYGRQRVMGIDFAAQGNDSCVATVLDRMSNQHWQITEQISWDEPDAMVSVGKIVNLIGQYKPDVSILDVGGMGHVVHNRLEEVGMDVKRFDGASTKGIDVIHYANTRAAGYYALKDWFDNGFLCIKQKDVEVIKQLQKIRMKFRSDGRRVLESKVDMKKQGGQSPDNADSLMMAVWGAINFLGKANGHGTQSTIIKRKTGSTRGRK